MAERTGTAGFAYPAARTSARRPAVEAMAMVTVVASLVLAVTAMSIGIARADTLNAIAGGDGGPFAVAVLLGLVMAGMGGLTAVMARGRTPPK